MSAPPEPQKLGQQSLPAVAFTDQGTNFTILFDRKTHLPAAIRTRDDDNIHGDSNYDLVLGDWKAVGGAQARADAVVSDQRRRGGASSTTGRSPPIRRSPPTRSRCPTPSRRSPRPPATGNVPYQWVLRRLFLTRFLDSDDVIFPTGGGLKLVELAPNVQHVRGRHRQQPDRRHEGLSGHLRRALRRAAVALGHRRGEGQVSRQADQVSGPHPSPHGPHRRHARPTWPRARPSSCRLRDKAYFEQDVAAPHTLVPDDLQKKPTSRRRSSRSRTQMSLKDDTDEIRLYNITNPHVDGMFIGHVVKANVVYVTDLISPRGTIERSRGDGGGRRGAAEIRHHRRHHRRRPRHHRQAGRHRGGTGGELTASRGIRGIGSCAGYDVMRAWPGCDPGHPRLGPCTAAKTWMPATSAGMTRWRRRGWLKPAPQNPNCSRRMRSSRLWPGSNSMCIAML